MDAWSWERSPVKEEMKTSAMPLLLLWKAPGVVGKSVDQVVPAIRMLPEGARVMAKASSASEPPSRVEA